MPEVIEAELRRLAEERVFGSTVDQWVREAEEAEEVRFRSIHGPEDAPPKPPWVSYWCEECDGWAPGNAIHGHGTRNPFL
jgi:hypothetical protein